MNQRQIIQKITPVKRLEQAFSLSDFTRELSKQNIKDNLGKNATQKKIQNEYSKRLYG